MGLVRGSWLTAWLPPSAGGSHAASDDFRGYFPPHGHEVDEILEET